MNCRISHPTNIIECEIDLPSSKSISNRLLIIQALCKDSFNIINIASSDDTIILEQSLKLHDNSIDVGDAGTAFRFLTAYFSIIEGVSLTLTGSIRLKERPIADLVDALRSLGADIQYLDKEGYAPIKIVGRHLLGGEISIKSNISSQFISALLLIAPTLEEGLTIKMSGEIVSASYIEMTLSIMEHFGVDVSWEGDVMHILPQEYIAKDYLVESDWSAAAFWFQIASLSKSTYIKLNGLTEDSIQGDMRVMEIFSNLGVYSYFKNDSLILERNTSFTFPRSINLLSTPDIYMSLRSTLFAHNIESKLYGLTTLKHKESDRIKSLEIELAKIKSLKRINTYNDHRIAMSLAPLCLRYGEILIQNSSVVSKSYPNFWKDLSKGSFRVSS